MANKKNKIKGYEIDFTTNTLYMNYKFANAAKDVFSKEYEIYQKICNDFQNIKVIVRAGRKAKTCNANKRLTYANMEEYISVQDNADELMAYLVMVQKESKKESSPYAYVRNWFVEQFPDYQECKVFKREKIVPFSDTAPQENEEKVS